MRSHEHPAIQEFLERFSAMMEPEGLPRPAGRMLGLLFAEAEAQTAEQLSRRLQISRSNVSTTVRLLETLGLVQRVRRPGERSEYFQLPPRPFVPMLVAGVVRADRMRDAVHQCRDALPASLDGAADRLGALEAFFGHAAGWLARMRDEWIANPPPEARDL